MKLQELLDNLVAIGLGRATLGDDNDGQLIIYTDLRLTDEDVLVPLDAEGDS